MSTEITRLLQEGKFERAREALMRMLRGDPRNPHLMDALAVVHVYLGELQRSLYFSEAALAILPESGPLRVTYANTLARLGKADKACEEYAQACAAADAPANGWSGWSALLLERGQIEQAVNTAGQGLDRYGASGPLLEAYFSALTLSGQPDVTVKEATRLLSTVDAPKAMLLAAVAGNYCDSASAPAIQEWHRQTGEAFGRSFPPQQTQWSMSRDAERVLRIGILSSDMRQHPVASFIEPLLCAHDRAKVKVCVFSTAANEDTVTERLKGCGIEWVECATKTEEQIREAIISRRIDILIELHGLTNGHRLGVCAMRAAPVQMTYCGYPNTTGLALMDYRIVDAVTDPEQDTRWHSERLLRMHGCFLCYSPAISAIDFTQAGHDAAVARTSNTQIVFGSFNTLAKISDHSLRLWRDVLRTVSGSRLLVKTLGFKDTAARERLLTRAITAGIDPARIELRGPTEQPLDHLRVYEEIDIALDTTPYNGTTTTCEALAMGVPVVTVRGTTHAARVGASVIAAAGHPEWVAQDDAGYVDIAARLARDPEVRSARATRAMELRGSMLCDATAWNVQFEQILRVAWREWCAAAK